TLPRLNSVPPKRCGAAVTPSHDETSVTMDCKLSRIISPSHEASSNFSAGDAHDTPHPPAPSPTQGGCPSVAGGRGAITTLKCITRSKARLKNHTKENLNFQIRAGQTR